MQPTNRAFIFDLSHPRKLKKIKICLYFADLRSTFVKIEGNNDM